MASIMNRLTILKKVRTIMIKNAISLKYTSSIYQNFSTSGDKNIDVSSRDTGTTLKGTNASEILKKKNLKNQRTYFEQSGWLPNKNQVFKFQRNLVLKVQFRQLEAKERGTTVEYCPPVQDLSDLIETNPIINNLVTNMLQENITLMSSPEVDDEEVPELGITTIDELLGSINIILEGPPTFETDTELIGVPLAALFTGIDATLSGHALFLLSDWNNEINNILNYWNKYLSDPESDSNQGFTTEGEGWLSDTAIKDWTPELYAKDSETLPYYNSWNSFFTREFANKSKDRPIAGSINDNSIITAPQDGAFYCIDTGVLKTDAFWFKDMPYSVKDIFTYGVTDNEVKKIFYDYNLVERFEGGDIFQCFLGPFNYHRWWSPVCGKILFNPQVINGFYYSKNNIPDIAGSTTASVRYLSHCNVRGIVIIETSDIGYVCCVPIGMVEVSTVKFNDTITQGSTINKGDELGYFQFGGSTFVILFEDLSKYGKKITWKADHTIPDITPSSDYFPTNQTDITTPSVSGTGNITCGMQIAVIQDI